MAHSHVQDDLHCMTTMSTEDNTRVVDPPPPSDLQNIPNMPQRRNPHDNVNALPCPSSPLTGNENLTTNFSIYDNLDHNMTTAENCPTEKLHDPRVRWPPTPDPTGIVSRDQIHDASVSGPIAQADFPPLSSNPYEAHYRPNQASVDPSATGNQQTSLSLVPHRQRIPDTSIQVQSNPPSCNQNLQPSTMHNRMQTYPYPPHTPSPDASSQRPVVTLPPEYQRLRQPHLNDNVQTYDEISVPNTNVLQAPILHEHQRRANRNDVQVTFPTSNKQEALWPPVASYEHNVQVSSHPTPCNNQETFWPPATTYEQLAQINPTTYSTPSIDTINNNNQIFRPPVMTIIYEQEQAHTLHCHGQIQNHPAYSDYSHALPAQNPTTSRDPIYHQYSGVSCEPFITDCSQALPARNSTTSRDPIYHLYSGMSNERFNTDYSQTPALQNSTATSTVPVYQQCPPPGVSTTYEPTKIAGGHPSHYKPVCPTNHPHQSNNFLHECYRSNQVNPAHPFQANYSPPSSQSNQQLLTHREYHQRYIPQTVTSHQNFSQQRSVNSGSINVLSSPLSSYSSPERSSDHEFLRVVEPTSDLLSAYSSPPCHPFLQAPIQQGMGEQIMYGGSRGTTHSNTVGPNTGSSSHSGDSSYSYNQARGVRSTAPSHHSPTSAIPSLEGKCNQVQAAIERHPVTLVCGPPMAGKSTLVGQALDAMNQVPGPSASCIHIPCKGHYTLDSILSTLANYFQLNPSQLNQYNASQCIFDRLSSMRGCSNSAAVFIFHKCEALRGIDRMDFLNFLLGLYTVSRGTIKSVMTSYNQYPVPKRSFGHVHISMMDGKDIRNFIRFYIGVSANLSDIEGYIMMIVRNNLCFPLAVRRVIEVFLLQNGHDQTSIIPSAEDIDRKIKKSSFHFLSSLLHHRVQEVDSWVSVSKRKWIALFCLSHDATSSEELLREMVRGSDGGVDTSTEAMEWKELMDTFAVLWVPGLRRLQFHPLLVYYFMVEMDRRIALEGMWFDISCGKLVKFLCGILCLTDEMSEHAGYKSAVFQCVLPEWPTVKSILQMAVHCNRHTYKDFCKVAMVGANLMVKWSTVPSIQFFQSLHEYASHVDDHDGYDRQSYRRQAAIFEGLMAHAIHLASGNSQKAGGDWERTNGHFQSSLRVLQEDGASFYLAQVYSMYGRALSYQGEYSLSIQYLTRGRDMLSRANEFREEREDHLSVSDGRIKDMERRLDVNLAMPLIFTGRNEEAKKILLDSLAEMKETGLDYATLDFVYNLLGLATQRGPKRKEQENKDKREALKFYQASLKERMDLEMFCPTQMVVPLNNIAMLRLDFDETEGARKMLEKALDIQTRTNRWNKYYTALTLLHKAEVCLKSNDVHQALKDALDAKTILDITCDKHDLRFHLQHHLGHTRLALEQEKATAQAMKNTSLPSGSFHGPRIAAGVVESDPEFRRLLSSLANSQKTEKYFENVCCLGEESKNDMSDNSNLYVLSALEHLVLLNVGNRKKMASYLDQMNNAFLEYPWIVKELRKPHEEISEKMRDHLEFHRTAQGELLFNSNPCLISEQTLNYLFSLVLKNCKKCRMSPKYFDNTAWMTRYCHSMKELQQRRCSDAQKESFQIASRPHSVTEMHDPNASRSHSVTEMDDPNASRSHGVTETQDHNAMSQRVAETQDHNAMSQRVVVTGQSSSSGLASLAQLKHPPSSKDVGFLSTYTESQNASKTRVSKLDEISSSGIPTRVRQAEVGIAPTTENLPTDLLRVKSDERNIGPPIVHTKKEEESSDYECQSLGTASDSDNVKNQTYAHVSDFPSNEDILKPKNPDACQVLQDHLPCPYYWPQSFPDYSDSSIRTHQISPRDQQRLSDLRVQGKATDASSKAFPRKSGLILPLHEVNKGQCKIETERGASPESETMLENLIQAFQQSKIITESSSGKTHPRHFDVSDLDKHDGFYKGVDIDNKELSNDNYSCRDDKDPTPIEPRPVDQKQQSHSAFDVSESEASSHYYTNRNTSSLSSNSLSTTTTQLSQLSIEHGGARAKIKSDPKRSTNHHHHHHQTASSDSNIKNSLRQINMSHPHSVSPQIPTESEYYSGDTEFSRRGNRSQLDNNNNDININLDDEVDRGAQYSKPYVREASEDEDTVSSDNNCSIIYSSNLNRTKPSISERSLRTNSYTHVPLPQSQTNVAPNSHTTAPLYYTSTFKNIPVTQLPPLLTDETITSSYTPDADIITSVTSNYMLPVESETSSGNNSEDLGSSSTVDKNNGVIRHISSSRRPPTTHNSDIIDSGIPYMLHLQDSGAPSDLQMKRKSAESGYDSSVEASSDSMNASNDSNSHFSLSSHYCPSQIMKRKEEEACGSVVQHKAPICPPLCPHLPTPNHPPPPPPLVPPLVPPHHPYSLLPREAVEDGFTFPETRTEAFSGGVEPIPRREGPVEQDEREAQ